MFRILFAVCALLLAAPSQAVWVSGSFTGAVTSESSYSGDPVLEHIGAPVTGSFYFDTSDFLPYGTDGTYMFNDADGIDNFLLRVDTSWGSSEETAGTHLVDVSHTATGDSLGINAFYPGGYGSLLVLRGAGLYGDSSLDSIQAGTVNPATSYGYSGYIPEGGRNGFYFKLTSAAIAVNAVPEPASWAMLVLGLGLMTVLARNRSRNR